MHCGIPNAYTFFVYKLQVQLVFIIHQVILILYEVWHTYFKCVVIDNVGYCFIYILLLKYLKVHKTLKC